MGKPFFKIFSVVSNTHKQAAAGGEIGANGEFYEGGQFIATTDAPKQVKAAIGKKPTGKVQTGPYSWEVLPVGEAPVYRELAVGSYAILDHKTNQVRLNDETLGTALHRSSGGFGGDVVEWEKYRERLKDFANRWNAGQRTYKIEEAPDRARRDDIAKFVKANQPVPASLMEVAAKLYPALDWKAWNAHTASKASS